MFKSRQLEILLYLLKVKKTTHRELAAHFGVSIKTIQRDLDSLSVMGIPLTSRQGNSGGVFIEESYKLSRSFLSPEDLHNIIMALSIYDSFSVKKRMAEVLNKLKLISPDLTNLLEHDANEYFVVDLLDEKIDMAGQVYEHINYGFNEEFCLRISAGGEDRTVAPISYVLRADGMYLYAFDNEYLLIRIADISGSEITELPFERDFIPYRENKKIAVK